MCLLSSAQAQSQELTSRSLTHHITSRPLTRLHFLASILPLLILNTTDLTYTHTTTMSTPKARMMAVRRQIVRTFKKHQLTLQVDAMEYLEDTLEQQMVPTEDMSDTLENIALGYVAREGKIWLGNDISPPPPLSLQKLTTDRLFFKKNRPEPGQPCPPRECPRKHAEMDPPPAREAHTEHARPTQIPTHPDTITTETTASTF